MKEIGITFNNFSTTIFSVLIIGSFILTGNYFIGKKKNNYLIYPQMRIEKWNTKFIFVNIITWMVYLLAYEIAFRGILLFPFIDLLGIELTIALNISIYALVHIPKGKKETLGAIPLGFVLCIITIETNSILSAWLIHVIMAVSNDIFALKANPKMQIQK
jgi:membrane protease YdiL (CAAX protease family)